MTASVTAYCVKCRSKTEMTEVVSVTMKNGRPAAKGRCGNCKTGMYKIMAGKSESGSDETKVE